MPVDARPLAIALRYALAGAAAFLGGSWLIGALAHVDDGRSVDHVAGTWMALATAANAGTLYPPFYEDGYYGGTRFAPLPIVLQAGAAQIAGEYLVSAKVLGLVLAVALVALTFALVHASGCGTPVALLLTSTLLVSGTGLVVTLGIRNDALPVILQLAALALVARRHGDARMTGAGVLCALAVASKLSAVWAPLAIVAWFLRYDRRAAGVFAGALTIALGLTYAVFQALSGGRMDDNLLGLALTTPDRVGELGDQVDRLRLIASEGQGLLGLVIVLALAATVLSAWRRALRLEHVAFVAACAITVVVLLDPGAFVNHLLDVQVLALPVVGRLWYESRAEQVRHGSLVRGAILVAVALGAVTSYREHVTLRSDVRALVHGTTAPSDRVPRLADAIPAGARILSEDPSIPVLRGERPVVLDPYMLIPVLERDPLRREELVARIDAGRFDTIVLLNRPSSAPGGYRNLHLGESIANAIERSYRATRFEDGRWIFEPR